MVASHSEDTDHLRSQITASSTCRVTTLGNAASRVMATLAGKSDQTGKLETKNYSLQRPTNGASQRSCRQELESSAPEQLVAATQTFAVRLV